MAHRAVIFVGPSLRRPAELPAELTRRAPAARGDVLAAAREGFEVIGLIDGVFHHQLAVTPREVRDAAALGVRLFGGASLGALRACECPDAMTGVGEIHARFVRGELTDDDEVAVAFDPDTYDLVAYPLVQIRELARRLGDRHAGAAATLAALVERVRAWPFHDRTRQRMGELAGDLQRAGVPPREACEMLDDEACDVKRRDALAVVGAVIAAAHGE